MEDVEETRKQFEDLVFNTHFLNSIEKTSLGGCLSFMPAPDKVLTQDELCKREGDDYKNENVSAMWFGWKKALETYGY